MSKRLQKAKKLVDSTKHYALVEACDLVVKTKSAKFDETVEIAVRLGIDASKSDQTVRGSAELPHGLGKTIRVAVFAKGAKAEEAKAAGADIVGSDDLVEKIKEGFADFDSIVATPDMMVAVGKVGKILGPRGLMPSPKTGSVTMNVADAVKSIKAGRADFRADKAGIVHAPLGKASFGPDKIKENLNAFLTTLAKSRPTTAKGIFMQSASISLSMGPGIKLDSAILRAI